MSTPRVDKTALFEDAKGRTYILVLPDDEEFIPRHMTLFDGHNQKTVHLSEWGTERLQANLIRRSDEK